MQATTFNIINEKDFTFGKDDLYIRLIQADKKYCIDISSRFNKIVRRSITGHPAALAIYNAIANRMPNCKDYYTAEYLCSTALKYNSAAEVLFIARTMYRKYQLIHLGIFQKKYPFKISPSVSELLYNVELRQNGLSIYFNENIMPLGDFVQVDSNNQESLFKFELNPLYL